MRILLNKYAGKDPEVLLRDISLSLRKNAFTVFLIDEVEKAPQYLQEAMLGVLDSDHIYAYESLNGSDGLKSPVRVDTFNSTFLLATNAGYKEVQSRSNIGTDEVRRLMIAGGFSEFLLDRCGEPYIFRPPSTKEEFLEVLKLQMRFRIEDLEKESHHSILIPNREDFLLDVAEKYYAAKEGFRAALLEMDRILSVAVAKHDISESAGPCELYLRTDARPWQNQRSIGFGH